MRIVLLAATIKLRRECVRM